MKGGKEENHRSALPSYTVFSSVCHRIQYWQKKSSTASTGLQTTFSLLMSRRHHYIQFLSVKWSVYDFLYFGGRESRTYPTGLEISLFIFQVKDVITHSCISHLGSCVMQRFLFIFGFQKYKRIQEGSIDLKLSRNLRRLRNYYIGTVFIRRMVGWQLFHNW